jgi:hypothetical protein
MWQYRAPFEPPQRPEGFPSFYKDAVGGGGP